MRTTCLSLAFVLWSLAASSAAGGTTEWTVSRDFRLGDTRWIGSWSSIPDLRFEVREYPDCNAVEWQVRLQAPAEGDSPLSENPRSADWV